MSSVLIKHGWPSAHVSVIFCTPVQPSATCSNPAPCLDQRPTLAELQSFKVNGETVSIIRDVAAEWKKICGAFNFDPNGRKLKVIEQQYPNRPEDCCRETFQTWLKMSGASWRSLISVLESCKEDYLADFVKQYVRTEL